MKTRKVYRHRQSSVVPWKMVNAMANECLDPGSWDAHSPVGGRKVCKKARKVLG
jgi:hypothetical protein